MTEKHIKRLDSVTQTVAFCELPDSVTATLGIGNFAPQVALVKGKIVIIQSYNQLGSATTKGVTLNIIGIRISMMQNTYLLANAIFSYGASLTPPDNNLMQLSKLNKNTLENLSKQNCVNECDRIQKLAAANAANILPFGASATVITDTAALVTLYLNGIDDPRGAAISRANANRQALLILNETILTELDLKLDTMANTLRFTNTEWWNAYRDAREILDPGTFSTILKIEVLNKANNDPLINVKCYRDNAVTFKKSSKLGIVTFKDIEQGPHSFVLKHKLFENLTIPLVMISHGKKHSVIAKMKPTMSGEEPVLTSVVIEGDALMNTINDLDTSGFTITPSTTVQIIVSGNELMFSAAPAPGPAMGPTVWHVFIGTQNKTIDAFSALIGADETNTFLKVQCNGPLIGHYKITFNNVIVP